MLTINFSTICSKSIRKLETKMWNYLAVIITTLIKLITTEAINRIIMSTFAPVTDDLIVGKAFSFIHHCDKLKEGIFSLSVRCVCVCVCVYHAHTHTLNEKGHGAATVSPGRK